MRRVVGFIGPVKRKVETDERREAIRAYCEGHEMLITEWLDEKCGSIGEAAYGDWLNGRKVDAVVVADVSVVSRNVFEFYAYKAVLKRRHSDLVVAKTGDLFPGYALCEKFLSEFIDTMCRTDMENQPVKTNNGRMDKAARGAYIGGKAPMGYKAANGKLEINPEEVPVVKFIMDQKRMGKTMLGTVNELNARGYRTRAGKDFVISTVHSIWKNEMFYKGYYRYGKDGEWVKGQHEPIIKE